VCIISKNNSKRAELKTIAIYNIKGGVGKTATAVNLAYNCAKEGFRTLIWDLDPQGAASYYLNVKAKVKGGTEKLLKAKDIEPFIKESDYKNLDILPADFSYRNMDLMLEAGKKSHKKMDSLLKNIEDDYDLVFLDAPPNISLVSENIFEAADFIIVPVIPTTLSMRTHFQIIEHFNEHKLDTSRIYPFFCMVDVRKAMHKNFIEDNNLKNLLKTTVPYSSSIEKMGIAQAPVGEFAKNTSASRSYEMLWEEIKTVAKIGFSPALDKIFGIAKG